MSLINSHRPLAYLFLCNLAIVFIGLGLFPILPLYAAHFGATHAEIGLYLSLTYAAIAAGAMLAGRLAERFGARRVFVGAGLLGLPAVVLLGQAAAFWHVVLFTAVLWFTGGIGLTLISTFTALTAAGGRRGRSFSLMSLASPVGALLGGALVGQLIAGFGYPVMFAGLGVVWSVWPLTALFGVQVPALRRPQPAPAVRRAPTAAGRAFGRLWLGSLLVALTLSVARLGTSLSMQGLGFSASAVAGTATVSGLVTIPVTLLIGVLSDRLGRRRFLMLAYGLAAGAALTLSLATQLWHFWLAATLMLVAHSANGAVSSAFATDLLAAEALARRLPWLNATNWLAGILAFAGLGAVVDGLGLGPVCLGGAVLALGAALQLGRIAPPPAAMIGLKPDGV